MKTKLLTLTLILLSVISFAQWTQLPYLVVGSTDTASNTYIIRGFGTDVYFGTNKGLFKSTDNGNSWTDITYAAANTLNKPIHSVLVASTGDIYTGSDKRLYKSTDGGTSWNWISTIVDSITYDDITEINGNIVISYNIAFASGGVYYSSNGGTSWSAATGLPSASPMRHFLKDADTLYLGGKNGVYKSIDNGHTWNLAGTGFPGSCAIFDVVKSDNTIFAGDVTGNGLFASTNNGLTWSAVAPSVFNPFCQVFSVAEANNEVLTSMDGACNPGGVSPLKISADTGSTWSIYMTGIPQSYYPVLGRNASGTSFFTMNGNGKDAYRTDLTTGIHNVSKQTFVNVYPNPAHNTVRVESKTATQIAIYDFTGKNILNRRVTTSSESIDISELSDGIYFLKVYDVSGNVSVTKLVKN